MKNRIDLISVAVLVTIGALLLPAIAAANDTVSDDGAVIVAQQPSGSADGDQTSRAAICQQQCKNKYDDCTSKNPHTSNPNGRAFKLHGQLCTVERDRCNGECK